jgi:hypothetical protein
MNDSTGRLIVAVLLLVIVGAAGVAAFVRYEIDDALKAWAAIGTLFGTLLGAIGTYYFAREATSQAVQRAEAAERTVADQSQALRAMGTRGQ